MRELEFALGVVNSLTSLISTPGVSAAAKQLANEQIEKIMVSIIKRSVAEFCAAKSGLVV